MKILTILQENARTPPEVIAEQVFISSPVVSARIERLEKAGLIAGCQAQLSAAEMGCRIKAFIALEERIGRPVTALSLYVQALCSGCAAKAGEGVREDGA